MSVQALSPSPSAARRSTATGTKFWIVMGAFWLAVFLYCMIAWVTGPDFKPVTFGRDKAPHDYVMFIRGLEVFMVALTAWIFYNFILKPLLRDGKFSFDGLFFLACFTLVVQEPWHAWIRPTLLYNDIFINYGSWLGYLPVSNPMAYKTPLPIAFAGLGYFWIYGLPAYCGSRLMSRAKARNPALTPVSMAITTFLGFCVFDFLIESFIHRAGLFIFPSTIPSLTLFAGTPHQFPVYEIVAWAGTYTVGACFHFFRNDKGETWADRNLDSVGLVDRGGRLRTFARWLTMIGVLQIGILCTYNIPYMFWSLHGDKFTVTEESHPWLTAGLCGPSTPYDCPGPGVPFARLDSPTNRIYAQIAAPTAATLQPETTAAH